MGKISKQGFNLSNTDRWIIYSILFVPLSILFFFMIRGFFFNPKSHRDAFLESRQEYDFHGTVDSIYRQKYNHNIMTLVAKNQEFTVDGEWEHKFQVGDSISKNQGSLLVEYYRNGQLVEILNYADLRKEK
jgi:hypothetical protein